MTVSAYSAILELRKLHSSSFDKNVNLATVRMAWMKRVSQGGMEKQNVFCYNLNFLRSRAQLHVQRLQPLLPPLKENREYFLAPKAPTHTSS